MKRKIYTLVFSITLLVINFSAFGQSEILDYDDYSNADKTEVYSDDFKYTSSKWSKEEGYNLPQFNYGNATFSNKDQRMTRYIYIDKSRDFEIETEIKYVSGSRENIYYFVFGRNESSDHNNYFGFYPGKAYSIMKFESGWEYLANKTSSNSVSTYDYNKLTVRKVGSKYLFYINETFVNISYDIKMYGNNISYWGHSGTYNVRSLKVSYLDKQNSKQVAYSGTTHKAAKKITLYIKQSSGSNGTGVAYNANKKLYYTAFAGNASFPLEVFDESGTNVKQGKTKFDVRGFWYNPKQNKLEGNAYSGGLNFIDLDYSGYPSDQSTTMSCKQPSNNSAGAYDFKKNEVLFYNNGKISRYSRSSGYYISNFDLSLPVASTKLNSTSVIYTGESNKEIGVLNYSDKKVYLFNYSGKHTFTINLPSSAITKSMFNFAYTNGYIWLFDSYTRSWSAFSTPFEKNIEYADNNELERYNELLNNYSNNDSETKTTNDKETFSTNLPPILSITDITFSESVLDAEETATLSIKIKNVGPGDAKNVKLNLSGYMKGLSFPSSSSFSTISANGGEKEIDILVKGGVNLPTGEATIKIEAVEPNFKVKVQGKQLTFPTRELRKPELILAQYAILENQSANPNNQIDINEMIDLKFAVQNVGQGNAENVDIIVKNNQTGVILLAVVDGSQLLRKNPSYKSLEAGKFETIIYRYFVNSEFSDNELQFTIESNERIGQFGFEETKTFPINKQLEESGYIRNIAVEDDDAMDGDIVIEDIPEFVVDVDTDIPSTATKKQSAYALIIGNEDYSSKQRTLSSEQNVDFAVNDAQVFANYCVKTIGIPKKQIKLLRNATAAEIYQGLSWINNLAKIEDGNAEIIFYYSGHGLPDENTKEPYLIPVDVSGNQLQYAVKMKDVYEKLTEHSVKKITVFLDACFSGGARNESLLAMKAVRFKPKEAEISNNLIVFSSSTGDESSAVYRDKKHGYFTYFLLKKLKETKGEIDYSSLQDYIKRSVSKETGLINKIQTPQVKISPLIKDEWQNWRLK